MKGETKDVQLSAQIAVCLGMRLIHIEPNYFPEQEYQYQYSIYTEQYRVNQKEQSKKFEIRAGKIKSEVKEGPNKAEISASKAKENKVMQKVRNLVKGKITLLSRNFKEIVGVKFSKKDKGKAKIRGR